MVRQRPLRHAVRTFQKLSNFGKDRQRPLRQRCEVCRWMPEAYRGAAHEPSDGRRIAGMRAHDGIEEPRPSSMRQRRALPMDWRGAARRTTGGSMKTRNPAISALLGLALVLPMTAHAVEDGDTLYVFCRATDIDSGRVFYSDVFPVQRQRYYDNDTAFAIAFSSHVDARWDTRTGHPARRGCWHEEQALDARMKRDRHAAAQRRAELGHALRLQCRRIQRLQHRRQLLSLAHGFPPVVKPRLGVSLGFAGAVNCGGSTPAPASPPAWACAPRGDMKRRTPAIPALSIRLCAGTAGIRTQVQNRQLIGDIS